MGKGNDAPETPDYVGAAKATAAGNLTNSLASQFGSMVNQRGPYGNLNYNPTGRTYKVPGVTAGEFIDVPQYEALQSMSPEQQLRYDQENALQSGLMNTAQTGLASVDKLLGQGGGQLDESKLAQSSIQGQAVQDAILSRLRPEMDRQQAGLDSRLANQGITLGSEAYGTAQGLQGQRTNDAMIQAALQGMNTGNAAREQGIMEQYRTQDRPLNIINALRTGNQITPQQYVQAPGLQYTPGADILAATQGQYAADMGKYNADLGQQNALMSGLFGLGAAALTGGMSGLGSAALAGGGAGASLGRNAGAGMKIKF